MRRALPLCLLLAMTAHADDYLESVETWHAGRLERLHSPEGYLSLVGLHRLSEGANRFGSAADNELVFPEKAPGHAGTIFLEDGELSLQVAAGVEITIDGEPVQETRLGTDLDEHTSKMLMGDFAFYVIERAGNLLLRVKDHRSPLLTSFEDDIERFPVDPKWNVQARWIPYDPPKKVSFGNVLGFVEEVELEGYLEFELDGKTYTMDPLDDTEVNDLYLIFGDATNGEETYGGGRFIHAPYADENGVTWIDFNRAYNPPCAFTAFSTCTLPPQTNRYPLRITAGEKAWHGGDH